MVEGGCEAVHGGARAARVGSCESRGMEEPMTTTRYRNRPVWVFETLRAIVRPAHGKPGISGDHDYTAALERAGLRHRLRPATSRWRADTPPPRALSA